jgi:membrane protein
MTTREETQAQRAGEQGRFAREDKGPEGPTDMGAGSWKDALKRTFKEFSDDKISHWAAALTYYGVLSIFPAILAMVSILGVIGPSATQPLIDNLGAVAPGQAKQIFSDALTNLQGNQGASTFVFIAGLAGAIWAASGYISGFMDASNTVWDVEEGRPIWKRLGLRIGVTILTLILLTVTALAVIISGPVAEQVGNLVGVGNTFVDVWDIAKWPVLVVIVSLMLSILYWAAPNVRQPGFKWVTAGGLLAVILWIVASLAFAFYVANFGSYNKTYGSLGGVIVFLVWLWITNIAILLGAEFNSELERGRQAEAGHPLDQEPFLPHRDEPKEK